MSPQIARRSPADRPQIAQISGSPRPVVRFTPPKLSDSEQSTLEVATLLLGLGAIPPWPRLMAGPLLAKLGRLASFTVMALLSSSDASSKVGTTKGASVLTWDESLLQWVRGTISSSGDGYGLWIKFHESDPVLIPHERILLPTEAGSGAMLYEAASAGNVALISTLLSAGVPLGVADEHANTPLHHAVKGGHAACCKRLLKARADPECGNMLGLSAWDLALQLGNSTVRRASAGIEPALP